MLAFFHWCRSAGVHARMLSCSVACCRTGRRSCNHAILQSCWSAVRLDREVAGWRGGKMQLARLAVQLLVFVLALPFACLAKLLECLQTRRRADDPDD